MNYRQAIEYVASRRRNDEAEALAFYKRLMTENADFHEIETKLRRAELELARGKKTEKEVTELREKREKLIDELGVRDRLYPPYRCRNCRDTGLTPDGKPCKCAADLTVTERTDNIELPLHDFSELDLALFGDHAPLIEKVAGRPQSHRGQRRRRGAQEHKSYRKSGNGQNLSCLVLCQRMPEKRQNGSRDYRIFAHPPRARLPYLVRG